MCAVTTGRMRINETQAGAHMGRLRQGELSIEDYVAKFCELSYQADFKESFLKDIFWFGLSKEISRLVPHNTHHWTLAR